MLTSDITFIIAGVQTRSTVELGKDSWMYMWVQRPWLFVKKQCLPLPSPRAYVYCCINHFLQAECHRVCLVALNKHCHPSVGITFTYCYCLVYVFVCTVYVQYVCVCVCACQA